MAIQDIKKFISIIFSEPDWLLAWRNMLFPAYCKNCDSRLITEENPFYCPACWATLPRIERPFCSLCGVPHPAAIGFGTRSNFPCKQCRNHPNPYIENIQSPVVYKGIARDAILTFKFAKQILMAEPLGALLREWIEVEMSEQKFEIIVPVPLHPFRLRRRGFNQSLLLAQQIVDSFSGAKIVEALIRIRPTLTQTVLSVQERKKNIHGAFQVRNPDEVKGKKVLLIDDIVTTATTVTECARVLKRSGAASIHVLSVARASDLPSMDNILEPSI
ncbi:MAG TPA: ComF family protein [Candidatus Hydrogenedens sp.]|nr:ComF family protein [Candidatus Hydrogenedens sp.]